jgi:hypothetical protein
METAKPALIDIRAALVVVNTMADAAPSFSPVTSDVEMQKCLKDDG